MKLIWHSIYQPEETGRIYQKRLRITDLLIFVTVEEEQPIMGV